MHVANISDGLNQKHTTLRNVIKRNIQKDTWFVFYDSVQQLPEQAGIVFPWRARSSCEVPLSHSAYMRIRKKTNRNMSYAKSNQEK